MGFWNKLDRDNEPVYADGAGNLYRDASRLPSAPRAWKRGFVIFLFLVIGGYNFTSQLLPWLYPTRAEGGGKVLVSFVALSVLNVMLLTGFKLIGRMFSGRFSFMQKGCGFTCWEWFSTLAQAIVLALLWVGFSLGTGK